MTTHLLLESALRSLIMGTILFAGMYLLRIQQVRAQRTAWLLALAAALAMPAAVFLHIGPKLLPDMSPQREPTVSSRESGSSTGVFLTGERQVFSGDAAGQPQKQMALATLGVTPSHQQPSHPVRYSLLLYVAVASFLLFRLVVGLALSLKLRNTARPLSLPAYPGSDIRVSSRIATPVTIASSVLLPETWINWEADRLRIVLRHEQSHVQRSDFYLLILANVHSAIFWFSPFSWWLQKQLSELGEALSDHAALEEAPSRASYAETLLEFATHRPWPVTGVAMARTGSLRSRIERLLSDRLYSQSFNGKRGLTILAASLVVLATAASTSLVRARAAEVSAVKPSAEIAAPMPKPQAAQDPTPTLEPSPAPAPAQPDQPTQSTASGSSSGQGPSYSTGEGGSSGEGSSYSLGHGAYSFETQSNGDVFAFVNGNEPVTYSGSMHQLSEIEALRHTTSGAFIYYRHDGKSYVIQDDAIITQAKSLYAPMHDLERRQEELGKQQEALGKQQEELGRLQEQVSVPTPDLKKEMASLEEALAKMKQLESQPTVDRESLADLQGKIGDIQGRLGELQGLAGEKQGQLGEQQGALGEQQGKLGEEQGQLGEQQGRIAQDAQRQLKPLIEQAIRDGRAKPVE